VANPNVSAVILAGGMGSRMSGVDKGLQPFLGRPMAQAVLERIQPQVAHAFINANRHLEVYQSWGAAVYPDAHDDFPGPLAGFAVGMTHATTSFVLVVPCDTPRLPMDLVQRLLDALQTANADMAMASAPQADRTGQIKLQAQPTCCLLKTSLRPSLEAFMQSGGHKVRAWTDTQTCVYVPFDQAQDDPLAFANINTLMDLQALESAPPHR
jgi:molybdopterin-guanine dinucleotide biosynthesis protein A